MSVPDRDYASAYCLYIVKVENETNVQRFFEHEIETIEQNRMEVAAMLIRRDRTPTLFREQNRAPRYLSNWLDEVFEDVLNDSGTRFYPELNVSETDRDFEISLELPGMRKEDIDISLDDNVLTVSGERKAHYEGEENGRRYHRVESRFGSFSRTLPLPNIIDRDNVSASYDNGVLTITIPKLEEKAGRKIEVS